MRKPLMFLLSAAVFAASAAHAEDKKKDDPNRMICEKQEVLGSRLASKRVCKTAAEWEAEKRNNRQAIDKAQTQLNARQ